MDLSRLDARYPSDRQAEQRLLIALAQQDRAVALNLLRDHRDALRAGTVAGDPGYTVDLAKNWFRGPILGEPELVEIRSQLGFSN